MTDDLRRWCEQSARIVTATRAAEIPEGVNEAYRCLVLDAPSLLPSYDMPVARMLLAEYLAERRIWRLEVR